MGGTTATASGPVTRRALPVALAPIRQAGPHAVSPGPRRAPGGGSREEANKPATPPNRTVTRVDPWHLWQALPRLSSIERVRKCRRVPTGHQAQVNVVRHDGGRVGFTGLQTCGSVHACPLCNGRILAERTDDVVAAVNAHHADGGRLLAITGTLPHERSTALASSLDAVLTGWGKAMTNGTVARRRRAAAWLGFVRRFEITDGENGWHPHVHALAFVGREVLAEGVLEDLSSAIDTAWCNAIESAGFPRPSQEHGCVVKLLDLSEGREAAAGYLTKGGVPETSLTASMELTAGSTKRGRRGSLTPWELLAELVEHGDAVDHARWLEYEAATSGRRLVTWTPGLRRRLRLTAEKTDEEIAAETDRDAGFIGSMTWAEWAELRELPGAPGSLIAALSAMAQFEEATGGNLDLAGELDAQLRRFGVREGPPPGIS